MASVGGHEASWPKEFCWEFFAALGIGPSPKRSACREIRSGCSAVGTDFQQLNEHKLRRYLCPFLACYLPTSYPSLVHFYLASHPPTFLTRRTLFLPTLLSLLVLFFVLPSYPHKLPNLLAIYHCLYLPLPAPPIPTSFLSA